MKILIYILVFIVSWLIAVFGFSQIIGLFKYRIIPNNNICNKMTACLKDNIFFSEMCGIEKLYVIQKIVDRLNTDREKGFRFFGTSDSKLAVNKELAMELAKFKSGENTDIITFEIFKDIERQCLPTALEKSITIFTLFLWIVILTGVFLLVFFFLEKYILSLVIGYILGFLSSLNVKPDGNE